MVRDIVNEEGFNKYKPKNFAALVEGFSRYKIGLSGDLA